METRSFYITGPINNPADIVAAEYFIDTDPGIGNGIALNVGTNDTTVNLVASISTASLNPGFHFLAIKAKDQTGKWGLMEIRGFYLTGSINNLSDIVAAEYFYDDDPGIGNGIPFTIPASDTNFLDSLIFPLENLPIGDHSITLRLKNNDGQWSLQETRKFKVCTRYGPISLAHFMIENNQVFFTNLSTDNDTTSWKFGDGTTDSVLSPIKTYASAGNYNLSLISKNLCASDTFNTVIRITGIQRINAAKAGNHGVATVIFEGNGFTENTILKLEKEGASLLPADKQFISTNKVIGYFNLDGVDTGKYHVVANLGGGPLDTLKNGFYVTPSKYPMVAYVEGGRNPSRFNFNLRIDKLQNRGNEDAIMVPFATMIGYRPGTLSLHSLQPFVDLTNQGIFQNTYQYMSANGISQDVMSASDIDTSRKKQILAYYVVKVPSESYVQNVYRISNSFGLLSYINRFVVHPPLFKSNLALNDISAPNARDCMNSFLKKAVKKNISVTISDEAWNNCFNNAFDTLARSVRDIVRDLSQQGKSIPMKSVYSTLLVQMSQCGSSGMPSSLTSFQFEKIIKDVTYNWMYLENLDSIGRPCFDTTETFVFNKKRLSNKSKTFSALNNARVAAECPGAASFPELGELCEDFADPCEAVKDILFADDNLQNEIGRFLFDKFTGMLGPDGSDGFCGVNSATAGCKKFCEQTAVDPNVKYGPGNNGDLKHVNFLTNYGYTIYFENLASATASAATVEIIDTIDITKFDISTFQIGSFGWGDSTVFTDANSGDYSVLKDLRPLHPNKLRVDVRIDTATGIAKWKFLTLDPATLQLTDDPAQGFLPPNTDGSRGVGFVSFSILPKAGVTSGTILNNQASIIFDQNNVILTPVWQHIVDTTLPQSQVNALPAIVNTADFPVNWIGNDQHSGIEKFAVYVSVNDSLFKQWKKFTDAVSDTFHGEFNKTYKFFSVAKDRAGNFEEALPNPYSSPDATTSTQMVLPVSLLDFYAQKSNDGKKADLHWTTASEQNLSYFEIQRSSNGLQYTSVESVKAKNLANGSHYTWQDITPLKSENFYRLKMVDHDASFKFSPVKMLQFAEEEEILVFPTITSSLVHIYSKKETMAELINIYGVILQQIKIKGNAYFNLTTLPRGNYFIRTEVNKQTYKVVKL